MLQVDIFLDQMGAMAEPILKVASRLDRKSVV